MNKRDLEKIYAKIADAKSAISFITNDVASKEDKDEAKRALNNLAMGIRFELRRIENEGS